MKLRLKAGVIEKIMSDRRLETDEQTAAILGVDLPDLELMRAGEGAGESARGGDVLAVVPLIAVRGPCT